MFHDDNLLTTDKKIVFYGAGKYARDFARRHCVDTSHIRLPDYVCDRDPAKWGADFLGVPIGSPDRLDEETADGAIVIVTTCPFFVLGDVHNRLYYHDFYTAAALEMRFLLAERPAGEIDQTRALFADDKSRRVFDALTQCQAAGQIWFRDVYEPHPYFGNDVVCSLPDGEVFVDAGAYLGGHVAAFGRANPNFRAVYAFEPHRPHFAALAERFAHDRRVKPFAQGLYDQNTQLAFADDNALGAHVVPIGEDGAETIVDVVRLDDAVDDDVSYIKMDTEGAELSALAGCEATIRRNRPKLAICTYHRPGDYLDIPRFVKTLRPDYRLYLRQHSSFNVDTVLYAV
jgi:FkbM family methyltransferase